MDSQLETTRGFFDDLLTMEINVILSPGMTARKMPITIEAFYDIAKKYETYLGAAAGRLAAAAPELRRPEGAGTTAAADNAAAADDGDGGEDGAPDLWKPPGAQRGGKKRWITSSTFDALAASADALAVRNRRLTDLDWPDEGQGVVLARISRNSRILSTMLPAAHEVQQVPTAWRPLKDYPQLSKENLVTLRKAWEVGAESVVMQTVAQVDGDILTRVQEDHVGAEHTSLHSIHRHMVGESLQHWRFLFATVASFTLSVFSSFFGEGD